MIDEVSVDDAVHALDNLADLLADSMDLRVSETPAIRIINDVIDILTSKEKQ